MVQSSSLWKQSRYSNFFRNLFIIPTINPSINNQPFLLLKFEVVSLITIEKKNPMEGLINFWFVGHICSEVKEN